MRFRVGRVWTFDEDKWYVDINSLEELIQFIKESDQPGRAEKAVVITLGDKYPDIPDLQIYDDYRE